MFRSPPVSRQGNQMGNPFALKPMEGTTPFRPSIGTSSANGATTSSPFGAPSSAGFGSSATTSTSSHSSSGIFGQGNQKGDSTGLTTFGTSNSFGSPVETSNSHGTTTWMFGQTSSPLSSTTFGAPSPYGFGSSKTLWSSSSTSGGSAFNCKQPDCGDEEQGSRISHYTRTADAAFSVDKLVSISAMPIYKTKSHEELRWEDYQVTGKGGFGLNSSGVQSSSGLSPFAKFSKPSWGSTSVSTTPVQSNLFGKPFTLPATQTPTWNFPGPTQTPGVPSPLITCSTTVTSVPINLSKLSVPFTNTFPSPYPTPYTSCASSLLTSFNQNPFANPFTSSAPTLSTSCTSTSFTPFKQNPFTNPFTSSAPTPSTSCTSTSFTPFKQNPFINPFTSLAPTPSTCTSTSFPPFNQNPFTNMFTSPAPTSSTSCTSTPFTPLNQNPFTNPFTSPVSTTSTFTSSLTPSGLDSLTKYFISPASQTSTLNWFWSTPISGPSISSATSDVVSASFSPVSSVLTSTFNHPTPLSKPLTQFWAGVITGIAGQSSAAQGSLPQITSTEQKSSAVNPFGTLPPKPHIFVEGSRSTQYGISSIPVQDKPAAPIRSLSLLTTRHLSRRIKLPVRKYDPKLNGPKVAYFRETKVGVFVPRENPRAFAISPEKWPPRDNMHRQNGDMKAHSYLDDITKGKEVMANVPSKLIQTDYYTQPEISELEVKEMCEPGFCSRVEDFVIGRHGYGFIRFLEETDVRKLDIEACVQFNKREVIVYMDETKKPPVGEGLNKPAEVTLHNIKCINKISGQQYTHGPAIDKHKEMLKEKAVAQGAEFVSYDPVAGEWKFRVQHF